MNARIIHKSNVSDVVLDELSKELPSIIAEVMTVPGGNLAMLRSEQVALEFSEASRRDIGSDIRIILFARSNHPRKSTENDRAKLILDRISILVAEAAEQYSIDIRIYLMEIGIAEQPLCQEVP